MIIVFSQKVLADEFKKPFTVPIVKKVTRIDENEEEIIKNISYIL